MSRLIAFYIVLLQILFVPPLVQLCAAQESLSDLIPVTKNVSSLKNFVTQHVYKDKNKIAVTGTIHQTKKIVVTKFFHQNNAFSVEAVNLKIKLSDIIPEAKRIDILFKAFKYENKILTIQTDVNSTPVTVTEDIENSILKVTGSDIQIRDFIGKADNALLNTFKFDGFEFDYGKGDKVLLFYGKFKNKETSAKGDLTAESIEISFADMKLKEIIPKAKDLHVLDDFSCDRLYYKNRQISLAGKLNRKDVSILIDDRKGKEDIRFTLTGDKIDIGDIFTWANDIALLNEVKFEKLQYGNKEKELAIDGVLGEEAKPVHIVVSKIDGTDTIKLRGDSLNLGDVVSQVSNVPGINVLGFDELTITSRFIETKIEINGHGAYLVENFKKNFTALFFDGLTANTFIPIEGNAIIEKLALDNTLFIITQTQNDQQKDKKVQLADLPGDLQNKVDFGRKKEIVCHSGININAQVNNVFKGVLERVGIYKDRLPLKGIVSTSVFSFFKHIDKKQITPHPPKDRLAFLKDISLSIDIPIPKIPVADKFIVFHDAMISLSGDTGGNSLWNKLPAAMSNMKPTGDLDISLQGGITLTLDNFSESMDALIDLNVDEDDDSFSLVAISKGQWKNPFGVKGVTLKDGCFDIALSKNKTQKGIELAFLGTAKVHDKDNLAVRADFDEKTGKLPVFKYIAIDGPIKLSDLNGSIPDGDKFELNTIKMDLTGLEAKIKLFKTTLDAYLFEYKDGVNFAIDLAKFKLGSLIPEQNGVSKNLMDTLNGITLPRAALVVSSKGILDTRDNLPDIGRDLFDDIYKNQSAVKIDKGISFIGKFSADAKAGYIPDRMRKLLIDGIQGVKVGFSETATITGTVKGVFDADDPFGLDLSLIMDTQVAIHLPKAFQRGKTDVAPGFFIRVMPDDAMIGVELDLQIEVEKTVLDFVAGFGIGLDEEGFDLNISGQVKDNLRIPVDKGADLIISNLTVDAEIKDDGTLHLGLGGKSEIDNHELDIAGDLDFSIPVRIPDGIAFKASLNKLDYIAYYYANLLLAGYVPPNALESHCISQECSEYTPPDDSGTEQLYCEERYRKGDTPFGITPAKVDKCIADQKKDNEKDIKWAKKWGKKEAGIVAFKNAYLSFGTPGAEDPILDTGAGVSMGVDLMLFKQHLGSPSIALDKDYIVSLLGKVKSVTAENKKVLVSVTAPSGKDKDIRNVGQALKNFNLGPLSFKGNTLYQYPLRIKSETSLFGKEKNSVTLIFNDGGLYFDERLKLAGFGNAELMFEYDKHKDDFLVEGTLDNSFEKWLNQEIQNGINEIIQLAKSDFKKLSDGLKEIEYKIKEVQKALETVNSEIKIFIHNAPKVVNARKLLDQAKKTFDGTEGRINKICGHLPLKNKCKKANHYLFDDAEKAVKRAQSLLADAEKMVAIPKALSDKTKGLKKKLDNMLEEKRKKQGILDITKGAEDFLNKELKDILTEHSKNMFVFNEAGFVGDLKEIKQHNRPFIAEVKYTINGKQKTSYLAFKPYDQTYTAKAFALIPAMILEEIITSKVRDKQKNVTTWLLALVNEQITAIKNGIKREIGPEILKYKKLLDTFETDGMGLLQARIRFMEQYGRNVSKYSMTDMMPPSKEFKNRYLAVGHSSLCLSVAPNGVDVFQKNCKDIDSEKWSTNSLENGYVQLKSKGLCLKARNAGIRRSSGQPLILSQCNSNDLHEQWKIISQDGFFDKIINKFSQKCLHFDTENANPKSAYAIWTSCLGADSQTFRDIEDSERATWHDVKSLVQAKNNRCLATKKDYIKYFKKSGNGHKTIISKEYNRMKQKGDDMLLSVPCDADTSDKFNYIEMVNGDIKIVHADSGWCVVPKHGSAHELRLAPCNNNKDMVWRTKEHGGNLFELFNLELKQCITIDSDNKTKTVSDSKLSRCSGNPEQLIDFVK